MPFNGKKTQTETKIKAPVSLYTSVYLYQCTDNRVQLGLKVNRRIFKPHCELFIRSEYGLTFSFTEMERLHTGLKDFPPASIKSTSLWAEMDKRNCRLLDFFFNAIFE